MTSAASKPQTDCRSRCSTCSSEESSYFSTASSDGSDSLFPKSGPASKSLKEKAEGEEDVKSNDDDLNEDIKDYQHSDIELLDFVHHIWGLDRSTGERILATPLALDEDRLGEYSNSIWAEDPHTPFISMANALLNTLLRYLGEIQDVPIDASGRTKTCVDSDESRGCILDSNDCVPVCPQTTHSDLAVARHLLEFRATPDEPVQGPPKESIIPLDAPLGEARPGVSQSTLKRSFDSVRAAEDEEGRTRKKARLSEGSPLRQSHLPSWASEALASTSRYWVTGLIVDKHKVTVCYFDRFLVACSSSFFLDKAPERLALTLYAMKHTDIVRAGFDPHLRPWPSLQRPTPEITPEMKAQIARPVKDVVGSYFEYPTPPNASSTDNPAPASFLVTGILSRPHDLLSRGTAVYEVRRREADGSLSDARYALKLSWPLKSGISEIDVVKLLKVKLPPESHVHLPDFLFTTTFDAADLRMPWLNLGLELTDKNHQDRVLRGMMGKCYSKLWEAGSIENFKQAWLDCLECHHLAHKLGKVLHRDLSESNLMILPLPDGTVKGVLNDWDMSKSFGQRHNDIVIKGRHCIGTPPFMAIELLEGKPYAHLFRHDLESFVYILIWSAVHYDLPNGRRDSEIHPSLEPWTASRDENNNAKYRVFTSGPDPMAPVYKAVKPEFKGLVQEWIEPLRSLFIKASMSYHMLPEEVKNDAANATYGGRLTFKTFMAALKVTPRTWGIVNFLDDVD